MSYVKRGNEFLVKYTLQEIENMYRKEMDVKAKLRLLCAIHRKKGRTILDIADITNLPKSTVSDYLNRIEKDLSLLYDKKNKGAIPKLSTQQQEKLLAALSEEPFKVDIPFIFWTTVLVKYYIRREFKKTFTLHGIRKILYRMGFTRQKPRQMHYKGNKEEQRKFKKKLRRIIRKYSKNGYEVFFLDETSFMLMHYLTHVWFPKGKRPIKRYAFDHRTRVFAFGALSFDKIITEITPSPNSTNFIKFLQNLHAKYKKLLLVMDNVSAHFTKMAKVFYKQHNIKVVPLPKYSPQCNPIELYWRAVKKWIANKEFFNKNMLRDVVMEAFEQRFLVPKISEYQVT